MKVRTMKNQKANWREQRVVLLKNSGETRKSTRRGYNTITLGQIFAAVDKPTALEKSSATAIIPSSYASTDARTHAVQREKGLFPMLAADIDKGDVALEHIEAAVDAIFGAETTSVIYSTSSATNENNKWRILAPLADPVPFDIWTQAQQAFFDILRSHDIVPDKTLELAGQLIYLPNVPPENRHEDGEPIHYKFSFAEGSPVDLSSQPLAGTIRRLAEAAEAAEANRAADRAARLLKKALRPAMGVLSPIERFNAENPLEDVLAKHGYEQKYAGSCDWRSPFQTSGSFATRVHLEPDGGSWSSLSGSDAGAGLGAPTAQGHRFGDAFDVFVHFEHNGDRAAALASISEVAPPTSVEIVAHPYCPRDPATIPPRVWVVDHLLLAGTVTVLTAPGGSGKTTFTIGMALSIATGKTILDMTVSAQGNVWIWNLEDDLDELERSIGAARQFHGVSNSEVDGKLFVDSALDGSELCTATESRDGMKLLEPVFDKISAEIKDKGIRVLIIDPFVSSHAVEENSNTKIDKIAKAWARVARATGCSIILVHHTSKAGAGEVSSASARGASALTSAARGVLVINKMAVDAARAVGVPDSDRWRYFSVQDDKHSRAPAEEARWFEIVPVGLANGDSVGVASPWEVPPDVPLYSAEDVRAVQELAAVRTPRLDFRATDWIGHDIGGVIGLDSYDSANRRRLDRIVREWVRRGYFVIEKRKDRERKEREYLVSGTTPTSIKDAIGGGAAVENP
jgi:KaiC/GvpD/RAD55 family RecA-like ATPase